MNINFLSLLIHPNTKESLEYDDTNKILFSSKSPETYAVKNGIPVLLSETNIETASVSALHQQYHTQFSYTEHYQKDAAFFDYSNLDESPATTHELQRLEETILNRIDDNYTTILDVGCGKAWIAKQCLPLNKQVISMDISTINPEKALQKYPHQNHFGLVADVYHLPIKDNSIDCIIAAEIMEHVAHPKQFVEILFSKLKPNGKLIITTPYNEKIEYNLCVHCNQPTPRNAHLHSFHETNITQLIPLDAMWNWSKFMNKYLAKLRTHVVLKYLPFKMWKWIDMLANKIASKPMRLLIEIRKL